MRESIFLPLFIGGAIPPGRNTSQKSKTPAVAKVLGETGVTVLGYRTANGTRTARDEAPSPLKRTTPAFSAPGSRASRVPQL